MILVYNILGLKMDVISDNVYHSYSRNPTFLNCIDYNFGFYIEPVSDYDPWYALFRIISLEYQIAIKLELETQSQTAFSSSMVLIELFNFESFADSDS